MKYKKEIVEALRSGEYEQGIGFFQKGNLHCVIGVTYEVLIKQGVPITKEKDVNVWNFKINGKWRDRFLHKAVEDILDWDGELKIDKDDAEKIYQQMLGSRHLDRVVHHIEKDGHIKASMLNDFGISFEVLADIIEKQN